MRVRPIFWWLLALACISLLSFASSFRSHIPTLMQVHAVHTLPVSSDGFEMTIDLHLSDPQGSPIDQAQILLDAHMTNMQMSTRSTRVWMQGEGNYRLVAPLIMGGPWAIHITASADGFDIQQHHLFLMVS